MSRGVWLFTCLCAGAATCAQEPQASVWIILDPHGGVDFETLFEKEPPDAAVLARGMPLVPGCAPQITSRKLPNDWYRFQWWRFQARCPNAFRRRAQVVEGELHLGELAKTLRAAGFSRADVTIGYPRLGFASFEPELTRAKMPLGSGFAHLRLDLSRPAPTVRVRYGWRWRDLPGILAPAVIVLSLPLLATLYLRRRALRAHPTNAALVVFSFRRSLNRIGWIGLVVWLCVLFFSRVRTLILFLIGPTSPAGDALLWSSALVPHTAILVVCSFLANRVLRQLGAVEWSDGEAARLAFWGQTTQLASLAGLMVAVSLWPVTKLGAALSAVAGIAVTAYCAARREEMQGTTSTPLGDGPLRDRVFALAEKAGVRLQDVHITWTFKTKMVNAFASSGNRISLTDRLIRELSRREVDAVVAHELAHLKRRHPWRTGVLSLAATALTFSVWLAPSLWKSVPWWGPVVVILGAPTLLLRLVARRHERSADAGAVAETNDPEAFLTAQAKLARLNLFPLQWSYWFETWSTHPSAERRIQAVSQQYGIPPERVAVLLDSPPSEEPHYDLRSGLEPCLMSQEFQLGVGFRKVVVLLAVQTLLPALAAWMVLRYHWTGPAAWAAGLGGFAAAVLLSVIVSRWEPLVGYPRFERRLRAKLASQGVTGGVLAGYNPHPGQGSYGFFTIWDAGLLFLSEDRLCYFGERTRWTLPRQKLRQIEWGSEQASWWPVDCADLHWTGGAFRLTPFYTRWPWQLLDTARQLRGLLDAWCNGQPGELGWPPSEPLVEPSRVGVPDIQPAQAKADGPIDYLWPIVAAAGVAWLFSLGFRPLAGTTAAGWYVVAATLAAGWVLAWPSRRAVSS